MLAFMQISARLTRYVRGGIAEALATRQLRWLQLSWLASSVAGWAFMVILSIFAYRTGGAAAVGLAAVVRMVPAGLAAPFTGIWADRRSRRDVLLTTSIARAPALGATAALVAAGGGLVSVLVLAALVTALSTAHKPAQAALLPLLVSTPRQLAASNAVWSASSNAGCMLGALLGGVSMAGAGPAAAFGTTAVTFAISALALLPIPRDPVPAHRAGTRTAPSRELLLGVREVAVAPALRRLVALLGGLTLAMGAIDVLVVVVALRLLGTGGAGVGWLNACWGLGGVLGGAVALMLLERRQLAGGLGGGALLVSLALFSLGARPSVALAVLAMTAIGIGYALVEVAGLTLLQREASDEVLARAFAVVESSYWLATGAGALAAPGLVALLGIRGAVVAVAGLVLVVAASWRSLSGPELGARVPEREFGLLRGLSLFASVPLAIVETLASRMVPVSMASGDVVIREGDPADRFYVVAEGELTIDRAGHHQALAGPGDFFGEIALLHDCPRTASITAAAPGVVYALKRDDFLAVVTGYPRARQAVDRVIKVRRDA
jgi:hypothetical protein